MKKKRLTNNNPDVSVLRDCLFAVANNPNNNFSFHKEDDNKWNFDPVYKYININHPDLFAEYCKPDTSRISQFFKKEITQYNTEQGEKGTRPSFQASSTPASSKEEQYSPEFDFDGFDSVASNEQVSDLSDVEDLKMPTSATKRAPTSTKKKAATAKPAFVRSGEDTTTVISYGHEFDKHIMIMRVVRTPNAEAELIADGTAIQINENWPEVLFKKGLLTQQSMVRAAPELKTSSHSLVASHCNAIAAIKPDPQKSTTNSTIVSLPFVCKPFSDTTSYVERKNGLYVFQIQSCNIMFIFLKDASASYQKDKKKKTKATKISLDSLNIDSDDSGEDPDYDPKEDDWYDETVDASYYMDNLIEIFGNESQAQEAVNALNAGGEERAKYLRIIYHLKQARAYGFGRGGMDIDEDDENDEDL